MLKKEKKKKKEKKNENKQEEKILGNLNTKAYQLVIIDGDETHGRNLLHGNRNLLHGNFFNK